MKEAVCIVAAAFAWQSESIIDCIPVCDQVMSRPNIISLSKYYCAFKVDTGKE